MNDPERTLEIVRRMALYGVGPGTTAEQVLETIVAFIDKRWPPEESWSPASAEEYERRWKGSSA